MYPMWNFQVYSKTLFGRNCLMYYYCMIQRGLHLTKISVMIHPAGTSDGSDKCNTIKRFWYWFYNGGLWKKKLSILNCLEEIREYWLVYFTVTKILKCCSNYTIGQLSEVNRSGFRLSFFLNGVELSLNSVIFSKFRECEKSLKHELISI